MTSTSHTVGFVINYTEDSPCLEEKITFSGFRATARTPDSCVQRTRQNLVLGNPSAKETGLDGETMSKQQKT